MSEAITEGEFVRAVKHIMADRKPVLVGLNVDEARTLVSGLREACNHVENPLRRQLSILEPKLFLASTDSATVDMQVQGNDLWLMIVGLGIARTYGPDSHAMRALSWRLYDLIVARCSKSTSSVTAH